MKLLTYDIGTGPRAGVLDGPDILDATTLLGATNTLRDVRALLEFAPTAVEELRDAVRRVWAPRVPLADVKLRAPILQPPTVRDHIAFEEHATGQWTRSDKQRMEVWARLPIFYFSNPCVSLVRRGGALHGDETTRLRMRAGNNRRPRGRNILEPAADDYILGFTIFNDWSCRDASSTRAHSVRAKGMTCQLPWPMDYPRRDGSVLPKRHAARAARFDNGVVVEGNAWNAPHLRRDDRTRCSRQPHRARDVIATGNVGGGSISEAVRKGYPARWLQRRRGGNRSRGHRHTAQSSGHA